MSASDPVTRHPSPVTLETLGDFRRFTEHLPDSTPLNFRITRPVIVPIDGIEASQDGIIFDIELPEIKLPNGTDRMLRSPT